MHFSVVIVGGGPAGLACARVLAENGHSVLLLERKPRVGPKVCAGGITWSGLINTIPGQLEEKRFPTQHIFTRLQHATVTEPEPIIATVNRERLGQHMASLASRAGAKIQTSCQVVEIREDTLTYRDKLSGIVHDVTFDFLVGADGSTSIVRRYLSLPTERIGVGINYQIPRYVSEMEWHLDSRYFGNGYGWIFPHSDTVSIGAYVERSAMPARQLKTGLVQWAESRGYDLSRHKASAEYINFDYRGWEFGNIYLCGDAAGFASGLTGEGIYPAIVSGEFIGKHLAGVDFDNANFNRLIRMQKVHAMMTRLTGKHPLLAEMIAETVTFGLRTGMLDFRKLEMAH